MESHSEGTQLVVVEQEIKTKLFYWVPNKSPLEMLPVYCQINHFWAIFHPVSYHNKNSLLALHYTMDKVWTFQHTKLALTCLSVVLEILELKEVTDDGVQLLSQCKNLFWDTLFLKSKVQSSVPPAGLQEHSFTSCGTKWTSSSELQSSLLPLV